MAGEKRWGLWLVIAVVGLLVASMPTAAMAFPPLGSAGEFPRINGPTDPEEYSWEVEMSHDQELRWIDDRHAGVFYNDNTPGVEITAGYAHDAVGANVPVTLAVTGPTTITFTVHHRAGNPLAGGAPFRYPISEGSGWEGGFQTTQVSMVEEIPPQPAAVACAVPNLHGLSLRASRRQLRRAHCTVGPIRGQRSPGARVVRQYRPAGKVLPAGTGVGLKLG